MKIDPDQSLPQPRIPPIRNPSYLKGYYDGQQRMLKDGWVKVAPSGVFRTIMIKIEEVKEIMKNKTKTEVYTNKKAEKVATWFEGVSLAILVLTCVLSFAVYYWAFLPDGFSIVFATLAAGALALYCCAAGISWRDSLDKDLRFPFKLSDDDLRAVAMCRVLRKAGINPDQLFFAAEVAPANHAEIVDKIKETIKELDSLNK